MSRQGKGSIPNTFGEVYTPQGELLFSVTKKDFHVSYFSGRGAGGQHRNKHQNCVRLIHKDTKVISTGQSHRSRQDNLREALNGMMRNPKFSFWLNSKVLAASIRHEKDRLQEQGVIPPEELKIEKYDTEAKKWVPMD